MFGFYERLGVNLMAVSISREILLHYVNYECNQV
jgi:hypothetical protein